MEIKCPYCNSKEINSHGIRKNKNNAKNRYFCKSCKHTFVESPYNIPRLQAAQGDMVSPDQYVDQILQSLKKFPLITDIQYTNPFRGKQKECAVLLLSDCQIGRTNYIMNPYTGMVETTYNTEIFIRQSQNLVKSIHRIIDLLSPSYQIEKLYIFTLGDLVDNDLIFRGQKFFIDMDSGNQLWRGTEVFAGMFRSFLRIFKEVEVFSVPGNHGRMTSREEASFASRNFDYHFMRILEVMFSTEPRIKFNIPVSYFAYPKIFDHRYMIHHGNDVYSWMSLPYYGIVRKSAKRRAELPFDVECIGHFHTTMEIPTSSECITLVNGGWIPRCSHVWGKYGVWSRAEQTFFGVSPKYARTWSFTISLEGN